LNVQADDRTKIPELSGAKARSYQSAAPAASGTASMTAMIGGCDDDIKYARMKTTLA
jgi:hypothetical protein